LPYGFRIKFGADRLCKPGHYLGVRLAIQWGVFEALGDVGEPGKTSTQLAESAGADPRLVGESHTRAVQYIVYNSYADLRVHLHYSKGLL
jgi:hypothetical protein